MGGNIIYRSEAEFACLVVLISIPSLLHHLLILHNILVDVIVMTVYYTLNGFNYVLVNSGVSYPVLATSVSVDSTERDSSSIVFVKCKELEKKDSGTKPSTLPLLTKEEHDGETSCTAVIPTCEAIPESLEDIPKQHLDTVYAETVNNGPIIYSSDDKEDEDDDELDNECEIGNRRALQTHELERDEGQHQALERCSSAVEEMETAEARSRCTSQGSEGTCGFMMDVVNLLQSADPNSSRPPSFSATIPCVATVGDEQLVRTEAEEVGRILEAACVNYQDTSESSAVEPLDASIFDSIERDIECISLGEEEEEEEREQNVSEDKTHSSPGSSSPSWSSSLSTTTRLLRRKRQARQQLIQRPPTSYSDAADMREEFQRVITALSASAQMLQRSLAEGCVGSRPAISLVGNVVYTVRRSEGWCEC